jgi:hypothetical protein
VMGRVCRIPARDNLSGTHRVGQSEDRADIECAAQVVEYDVDRTTREPGEFLGRQF